MLLNASNNVKQVMLIVLFMMRQSNFNSKTSERNHKYIMDKYSEKKNILFWEVFYTV